MPISRWISAGALLAGACLAGGGLQAVSPRDVRQAPRPTSGAPHRFALSPADFLYDGQPLQIISCEMHPARMPAEYWRHRIQMAKAMGCNTIAAYIFWNYHEIGGTIAQGGRWDFASGNHDIARFFRLVQAEGLHAILRPGPYVCAEWDFGGLPAYLLKDPELRVRAMYPPYVQAAGRYLAHLAPVVTPLLVTHGGPILMVQIENEYGSYANDRRYIAWLRDTWRRLGVDVPFYTADGPTPYMLEAGSLAGAAVGLDSGTDEKQWDLARSINPGVPIFSSETYPGWLTHWGEKWQRPSVPNLIEEVTFLLDHRKSFNFYVAHGGTNFGLTAGANSGGKGYEPDITSYDYDAPIDEQGRATPKYLALRDLIASKTGRVLPPIPDPIPIVAIPPFEMLAAAPIESLFGAPAPILTPRPFESWGQNQGLARYRTRLVGRKSGKLTITDLHDFATIFVDGKFIGSLDRRLGEKSIDIPAPASSRATPTLDIIVEGMGHINFAQDIIDRKGITDRVTLAGMTLMDWTVAAAPLAAAPSAPGGAVVSGTNPGTLFTGAFSLSTPGDTFFDLSGYAKGYVWVNGHLLGRYWNIGPQLRLYCPASWLKTGRNDVTVLDLLKTSASPAALRGLSSPDARQ